MYEVDNSTFDIYEAYSFYSNVDSYSTLKSTGPTYAFEYSTRKPYGAAANWPSDSPLNATFWHEITVAMEKNRTLLSQFNTYPGKMSLRNPNCTSVACAQAKVCYMRAGSAPLGKLCPQGFASVQGPYMGTNF